MDSIRLSSRAVKAQICPMRALQALFDSMPQKVLRCQVPANHLVGVTLHLQASLSGLLHKKTP
eukprot:3453448-Amphidinium_carterae.1